MSIIKITDDRKTNSLLINNEVYDDDRIITKRIILFGITIWSRTFTHRLDYKIAQLETKSVGFAKSHQNEKAKEK